MKKRIIISIIIVVLIFIAFLYIREMFTIETNHCVEPYDLPSEDKPVIYIYSNEEIDVEVKLEPKFGFTCTYPKYNEGWKVKTKKDGMVICDGKEYNYLYWEGKGSNDIKFKPEYCVEGKKIALFLEKKLEELGLTRKEANEFIVYWLPRMEQNAYNLISFNTEEYCKNNPLSSNPQYKTLIRVFMTFKGSDEFMDLEAPSIETPKRDGLTIVEWGGMEIKNQ